MSDPASEGPRPANWRGFLALTLGLAILIGVTLALGWRPVVAAAASVSLMSFVMICLWWLVVVVVLGLSWFVLLPDARSERIGLFAWARLVREAASDILPFSQIGGLVIGARVATAAGLSEATVWASLVGDLTTEMAAQALYTLAGVGGLLALFLSAPRSGSGPLWAGTALLAAGVGLTAAFVVAQRRGIGAIARLATRWLPDAAGRVEGVAAALDALYARPGRLATSTALHLLGWAAAGFGSWLTLGFMHAPAPLWAVLVVESLMYAVRAFGFAIPGALGVQEGAYALIGPLFGIPANDALALSLIKRARDVAVGAPTLVIWRLLAARALTRRG